MLSDRAVALARRTGDQAARLRAEALALFASNRLGRGVSATVRALAAVRDAEAAGDAEVAAELRVELAWCARSAGTSEVAVRVLNPVLELERIEPAVRAHALLALAASLPAHRQDGERSEAIDEAERLYEACGLGRDTVRLLKARVCAARAGHHRRLGEFGEAIAAADAGLALLRQLGDPAADSGEMHTRLVLERVQSLLETGRRPEAVQATESVLAQPVRAAAAGPVGWLGLAMATRVHLPDGNHWAAVRTLNDAAAISERHKLDGLLAETLSTLSHVHERAAEFAEALRALRGAYSADRRWRAAVHNARTRLLAEFPVLAGDVEVPRQSSGPSEPAPPGSGPPVPEPPGPRTAAEPPAPQPPAPESPQPPESRLPDPEPSEPEPEPPQRRRSDYEDAHDAARRLMETLTNRAAGLREEGHHRKELPEQRPSDESAAPTVVFDSASLEPPATEAWQSSRHTGELGSQVEPVTFAAPADRGLPSQEAVPDDYAEPTAAVPSPADWWPSESWDQASSPKRTIPEVPVASQPEPAEPESAGPESVGSQLPVPQLPKSQLAKPQSPEPQSLEPQSLEPQSLEFQPAESLPPEVQASADALAAAAARLRRSTAAADPGPAATDVTTILPVIPGPPGPDDWSGTASAADPQYAEPQYAEPQYAEPQYAESHYAEPQYGHDRAAADLPGAERSGYRVNGVLQDELGHDHREPDPAETPATEAEKSEGGRRSRGRSLAEIRASLQLSDEPRTGRRRARHAEPADPSEPAAAPSTAAAEVLGRHRQDWATEPNLPVSEPPATEPNLPAPAPAPAPAPPAPGPGPTASAPQASEPAGNKETAPPATDAGPAEKIGLAELLTEALMAYETGRRGEPEAPEAASAGRHSEAHVSGITGHSRVSRSAYSSTSDGRESGVAARHRRPGIDSTAADPLH